MPDLDALKTLLESDARYDEVIRRGANGECVTMLNEPSGGAKRWRKVTVDDFLGAIAGETLTAIQQDQIRTYTQLRDFVPLHKAGVRQWIMAQGWSVQTIDNLKAISQVPRTFVFALLSEEDEAVTLRDVRRVVRRISKSFIVTNGQAVLES